MSGRNLASALSLFAVLTAAAPAVAQDQTPDQDNAVTPDSAAPNAPSDLDRMASVLQDMGYRAAIDESTTPPSISSRFEGVNSYVQVLSCDEGTTSNCQMLRFYSGFDFPDGVELKLANDWNAQKYFGRAYLNADNDPYVDIVVSLVGVSDENLHDMVEWWEVVVSDFKTHIDW